MMNSSLALKGLHLDGIGSAFVPIWYPLAPGWYVLALLFAVLLWFVRGYLVARKNRMRPLQLALDELEAIFFDYQQNENNAVYLQSTNRLLRQVAIHQFGREKVAPLTGQQWVDFLNRHAKKKNIFAAEQTWVLAHGPYVRELSIEVDIIQKAARCWLKNQRLSR